MKGIFRLSDWQIPYLSVIMNLEDAADHLNLTAELPGAESIAWKIDELFQRDIDWPRVQNQILPYLLHTDQPQFFNSLTIALLPYYKEELQDNFAETELWMPPTLHESGRFAHQMQIGPISIGFWDPDSRSGILAWNTDQLYGVAIDGQHRLAAIKAYSDSAGSRQSLRSTTIPVTLLIFDEALGYASPTSTTHIDLLRTLFIDLNKHSITINRARQILLDDRDPHSVCVRQLVANSLADNIDILNSLQPRMPLSIVDWHTEQAKFDKGPFITTILGLDWMVGKILNSKPIKDFTDYKAVETQVKNISTTLKVPLDDASRRIQQRLSGADLTPFSYTTDELRLIEDAFAQSWTPVLCKLLTAFTPYKEFLDMRASISGFTLDFQHWYELYQRADADRKKNTQATKSYQSLVARLQNRNDNPITSTRLFDNLERLEEAKSDSLAFNVVFQKAYISAFLEFNKIHADHIEELLAYDQADLDDIDFEDYGFDIYEDTSNSLATNVSNEDFESTPGLSEAFQDRCRDFLYAMNKLIERWPDFLQHTCRFSLEGEQEAQNVQFWLGTLLKSEGTIDFTQGAADRAKELLFLIGAMYLYDEQTDPETGSSFDRFWQRCQDTDAPKVCKRAKNSINRFMHPKTGSPAHRILKSKDVEYNHQRAQDEIYYRLQKIWIELEL